MCADTIEISKFAEDLKERNPTMTPKYSHVWYRKGLTGDIVLQQGCPESQSEFKLFPTNNAQPVKTIICNLYGSCCAF